MTDENQKQEFIEAIENDESYEWELNEDVFIHTDHEFDGTFLPTVHDRTGEYTEQEIDDLMAENGVFEVFEWDILEWSEGNQCWYPVVTACDYENVDHSVWE